MNELFRTMTYKEFKDYCNERIFDGKWSPDEACICIAIIGEIENIEVRTLGVYRKKQTEQAKEEVWNKIKYEF